uniref:Uncharacterized protein n=1 Tax=Anopheles atroparvus TaxID=41427 RepID=A0A182IUZ3_ANOAO
MDVEMKATTKRRAEQRTDEVAEGSGSRPQRSRSWGPNLVVKVAPVPVPQNRDSSSTYNDSEPLSLEVEIAKVTREPRTIESLMTQVSALADHVARLIGMVEREVKRGDLLEKQLEEEKKRNSATGKEKSAVGEATFLDLYKAVRNNTQVEQKAIDRPRRTGDKTLTLYLKKSFDSTPVMESVLSAVGEVASTRLVVEQSIIELKGVDMGATAEEVADVVAKASGLPLTQEDVRMWARMDGSQVARIRISRRAAGAINGRKLTEIGLQRGLKLACNNIFGYKLPLQRS